MTKINQNRNSNIELLRIVAMFMIICHHTATSFFNYHNLVAALPIDSFFIKYFSIFIFIFGKVGVALFILISGYFMYNREFTKEKGKYLAITTYIYAFLSTAIMIFVFKEVLTLETVIKTLMPFAMGYFWFITDYMVLMIVSPILNAGVEKLSKEKLYSILSILTILYFVMPTVMTQDVYGVEIFTLFPVYYMIGAYIRKNIDLNEVKPKKCLKKSIYIFALMYLVDLFAFNVMHMQYFDAYSDLNSILILLGSVYLFVYAISAKEKHSNFINLIGSTSLGVYMFHTHTIKYYVAFLMNNFFSPNSNLTLISIFVVISSMVISVIAVLGITKLINIIYHSEKPHLQCKNDL